MKKLIASLIAILGITVITLASDFQLFTNNDLKTVTHVVQGDNPCCVTHNLSTVVSLLNGKKVIDCYDLYTKVTIRPEGVSPTEVMEMINANPKLNVSMAMVFGSKDYVQTCVDEEKVVSIIVRADRYYNRSLVEYHLISIVGQKDDKFIIFDSNSDSLVEQDKEFILHCMKENTVYYTLEPKENKDDEI